MAASRPARRAAVTVDPAEVGEASADGVHRDRALDRVVHGRGRPSARSRVRCMQESPRRRGGVVRLAA